MCIESIIYLSVVWVVMTYETIYVPVYDEKRQVPAHGG